ncbi:hypothetical protein [Proteiniphilum sp. UBA5384]|uniref:hypothetical protein n=1 Tax=Proteiniphilum sp. UBA5384 TaxID=1947279 RepID=UPI0025D152EB|nr:hypothetical protein [Proteiniphilum sp. UBA5384]
MKLKSFLFTLSVAILLASCSSDEPDAPVYVAEMTSFGFYAEDNGDIIVQDYIASSIGPSISILLPEDVDKTALVARFTVSENDVVKVGTVVQQSGVTVNDFTGPVDYIVSEGTANVKYTITVGKAPEFVWTSLPAVEEDFSSLIMDVSPTGVPYIVYKMKRDESDEEALGVMTLKDGAWTSLGQPSEGRVDSYYDIAFTSDNLPVVSYLDFTSPIDRKASVKSWNGTTWSAVGSNLATTNRVSHLAMNYATDNKLMVFARYELNDNVFPRRALTVNSLEGGTWIHNAKITGRTDDLIPSLVRAERLGNALYLGAHNSVTPNTISIYKYENGNWTTLVDKWTDENATGINVRDFEMAVDKDGNVYAALADNSSEGVYKYRVIKWEADTKQISSVGSYLPGASGGLFDFDLALSPLGVPYLFYRNESLFPTVVSLDKDTQDWTTPNILEASEGDNLSIGFAPDGKAYAVYTKNRTLYSYKYDAPGQ